MGSKTIARATTRISSAASTCFRLDHAGHHSDYLPIAGTGTPKPCPFCQDTEEVRIVIVQEKDRDEKPYRVANVECRVCGASGPSASTNEDGIEGDFDLVRKAAQQWNDRRPIGERYGRKEAQS